VPRGLNPEILKEKATDFGLVGKVFDSVSEAYDSASDLAMDCDFIYIGGSTFVVAEIV
jgi:dihydrofolate synthase/folylpolyglutamate synthase